MIVSAGDRRTAALMNRKAYQKSLENGSPWIVHPKTGRILPWPGSPRSLSLEESFGSYSLILPMGSDLQPYGTMLPADADPDGREDMNNTVRDAGGGGILTMLSELIAERHRTMPEGSYTTHLFSAGPDKIRKKVGEEAVELLLAQEDNDVIYETADLIYHVQVLLEALDLKWADVEAELSRRHSDDAVPRSL